MKNNISFKNQNFFIGIDVHKKSWNISIRHNNMLIKNFSIPPEPHILANYLFKNFPLANFFAVYEMGFSGFWIARALRQLNINTIIVNPADIPTSNKEKDRKSDTIDSNKLARELENNNISPVYIPDINIQHLRSLSHLYHKTVQNSTRVKNRIKGIIHYYGIKLPSHSSQWSNNFIQYLKSIDIFGNSPAKITLDLLIDELLLYRTHLADILKKLKYFVKLYNFHYIIKNIMSVPGVGFKSAITIFSEIGDMNRFKNFDKLKYYVGLVPSTYASGETSFDRGITFRRNKYLRYVIIESAWVAIRKDSALLFCFNNLCKRMRKQEAIIRIARKLLSRIRFVWLNNCQYETGIL